MARTLLADLRKQDAGTELLRIRCAAPAQLETRARKSGEVIEVELRLSLQLVLRDSAARHWRLHGTGVFEPRATAFIIASTEQVDGERIALEVVAEATRLVSRRGNDFSWSSWRDSDHARGELDDLCERLERGELPLSRLAVLFAPTGPLQELGEASGWPDEFLELANRLEAVVAAGSRLQATFPCSLCAEPAATVAVERRLGGAELRRESFTSAMWAGLSDQKLNPVRVAVAAADAAALFALDFEYAPFYCPTCQASYCGAHWEHWHVFDDDWPVWHDSTRGRCPRGHERMLED